MDDEDYEGDFDSVSCQETNAWVADKAHEDFVTLYEREPTQSDEDQGYIEEIAEYYYDRYCGRYC